MKGIILAGGSGSRLYPITVATSKQLLPLYDKPLIYYPLSTLMIAGIKDILIISNTENIPVYKKLLGNGKQFGIKISYESQAKPNGIAEALIIGEKFTNNENVALILGDNFFYGASLRNLLNDSIKSLNGATVFTHKVKDPKSFGVLVEDSKGNPLKIIEKPQNPNTNWAVTGLYLYDKKAASIAKNIKPSNRGELEITCLNNEYIKLGQLSSIKLGRGFTWMDTGSPENILAASTYIKLVQEHQNMMISCPEEIALANGWISPQVMEKALSKIGLSNYGLYLKSILKIKH